MNRNYFLKSIQLKKVIIVCLLFQLFFLPKANAQWSSLGGGSCDLVYCISPDVTGTGIYFGMNYGNCPTYPSTKNYIQHWNGSTVSNLNASAYVNGYIYAIAVSGNNVYVGGDFTTANGAGAYGGIACWNTSTNTWSNLGSGVGGSNKTVYALTLDAINNILYAGGEFTTANGTTVNNVAAYNIGSSTWSAMGTGVTTLPAGSAGGTAVGVYALTMCGSNLFVGGRYVNANGSAANNIAAWNGSAWSTLTSGGQTGVTNVTVVGPNVACAVWDAAVMALTNDGVNVYVGGDFDKAGGTTGYANIGSWNTSTSSWSKLGTGVHFPLGSPSGSLYGDNANVWALTMYNGNVVAGGDFEGAGGTVGGSGSSLFAAQWNGSTWSGFSASCGGGLNSDVFALGVSNSILYAGGQFDSSPSNPKYYIAQYTGAGPTISISVPATNTICAGASTTLTASGGATSYTWSPASTLSCTNCASPTASPTVTTTYTVTGSLAGCTSTKTVQVVVNPKPTITLTPTSSTLCGSSSNTTITASGASTYTWASAATLSSSTGTMVVASPTATTIYTVNATDGNGCTNNNTVTITVSPLPSLTLTAASPTVCIGTSTTITATGANTYTWTPLTGLSSGTGSLVTATPTITTNYTVNGTSGAGCINSATVTITVNPLPTLTLTASSATVCAGTTSTLTAAGANTYTWSPSSSLSSSNGTPVTATPTATTIYTVNGTDANGCVNNKTITLNINPLPTLTVTASSATVCSGNTSTLTASGANTYTWSPSSTLSSPNGSPVVSTPTASTIYTVNATDNNGCANSNTVSVSVVVTPSLTVNPATSLTLCLGDSTVLSATGGTTYTWTSSPSGSLSSTSGTSVTATPSTTTIYTVNGTSGSCAASPATATITVNLPPDISVHAFPSNICTGNSSTLVVTGVIASATWTPSGSLNAPFGSPVIATPTITTEYVVTATGTNGCTKKDSIKVTVNPTPTLSISSGGGGNSQDVCSGATVNAITFSTSTGSIPIWYNSNTNIGITATDTGNISSYTAPTVTVEQTGTITVVAIDSTTGCKSDSATSPVYVVNINPLPIISASDSLTPGGCGGLANGCISNVAGQAPGVYQYSWDNGVTWSSNSQYCNIPAGNYVVEVKDANGCISSKNISLPTANSPANPIVAGNPVTTCAGDTINFNITNPQPSMTYTWTTSSGTQTGTTFTINNVNPSGTYTVGIAVADSNACLNDTSFSFTVNAPPQPVISGNSHFCNGASTTLSVSPTGANYTYQWNNAGVIIAGATSASYTATSAGAFGVSVTNTITGCSHDTVITITVDSVPPVPIIATTTNNNTYCQGTTIDPINVTGSGTFTWYSDAGLTNQIGTGTPFTPSVTVTSTLYVTASSSVCTSDSTPIVITINPIPPTPTITVGAGNNAYCANVNPLPAIVASGPSTIIWYSDATLTNMVDTGSSYTPTGLPLGTTTYYLIDSSAAGCKSAGTATVSVTINPNPATPLVVGSPTYSACQNDPPITLTASGASTIVWYDNATLTNVVDTGITYTPTNLPVGTTTFYLVDSSAAGCKSLGTATVSVTINATPTTPTVTSGNANAAYCQGSPISPVTVSGSGTIVWYTNPSLTAPAVYTGNSYTPIGLLPNTTTTYYITDTSAAGCKSSGTATVTVTIYPKPSITGSVTIDSALCGNSNGAVWGLTAIDGTPQYAYQWVDAGGNVVGTSSDLTNVAAGTYSLIVIDANQCRDTATNSGLGYVVGGSNAVIADFTPSTYQGTVPLAVTFTNTSSANATAFSWNFGTNTSTSTQINPSYTYTDASSYVVTLVAYSGNCTDTARKTIVVNVNEVLIIPNIFSPNGDAINDQFFITSSGISTLNCDIYNRWGELLFTIKEPSQAWDGKTPNGGDAPDGTYFYILQATGFDGTVYKKDGPLTLVR